MTVNDEASAGSQRHHRLDYHHIFDRSAIPLWVEDISALRLKLEQLRSRGVTDIRRYAADHPELVRIAAEAIRVVDVNDASLALYGAQSKTELLGPLTATLDREESQTIEGLTEDLCAIYEGREHTARNGVAVTADGRRIDIAIFSYLPAEPGARDFMLVSVLDITEQRRAERALRESEERFRSVVEQSIGAVIIIGPGERIIFWNAAATTLLGHTAAETIGNHYSLVLPEDAQEEVSEDYTQSTTETRMRAKDGHLIDVEYTRSYWKMGEQSFSTLIVRDITARRRIEARMQEQAQLLDIASDAIIVTDMRRRIRYWNKSAERTYGWTAEEALGQDANELIHEASDSEALAVAFRTTLDTGQWRGEFHHVTKEGRILSGETRWTLVKGDQGRHIGVLSVTTDITERKALEAELLRSQRLESIGTLAGGIAHDLNNVLTPILTGVEALGLLPMDERSKRTLEIIRLSTLRGANIIRQVLSFARGVKGEQGEVQLSHLFREIESIIRETFP
ncbi:MAG TPA: PAS domain S-box protein, partial [Spirochaetia bacterium]|nr:PAS domain S-box protein [Spirochaetia bacterium]